MHKPTDVLETRFRKSTYSGGDNNDCVEIADAPEQDTHLMRDTKHRDLGALLFGTNAWAGFVGAARS